MKKLNFIFTVFAFVALTTGSALAQTDIDASAEVRANLAVAQEQETNFGLVDNVFSSDPELDPSDGANTNIIDDADVTVGLVSVAGTGDQTVTVGQVANITLQESGSGPEIIFAPTLNWTYDNLTTGGPTNPELGTNATGTFDMTLDGTTQDDDGTNTILIGGTLSETESADLPPGDYTGTGSIDVNYQ